MNKSNSVPNEQREQIACSLPKCAVLWTEQGCIPLNTLPVAHVNNIHPVDNSLIYKGFNQIRQVFTDPGTPIVQAQQQAQGWSVGWCWHPSRQFDVSALQQWLESWSWRRAKLVIHAKTGWFSTNCVDNTLEQWKSSEWRKDSRLELIFDHPQDLNLLLEGLEKCLDKGR